MPTRKNIMKTINPSKSFLNYSSSRRGSIFIPLGLVALLAVSSISRAVTPAPDGGYPGGNTAEGQNALLNLTTGTYNTAIGWFSLESNTIGNFNTAIGAGALLVNASDENTATGTGALLSNTTGLQNTANGAFALFSNTEGSFNTATGDQALFSNTTGIVNTAIGAGALTNNTTGHHNTAVGGDFVLFSNTIGTYNTAVGVDALASNTTAGANTANGAFALFSNTTGSGNTAIGTSALQDNTTGGTNTAIGTSALNSNTEGEANTATGAGALVNNTTGHDNTALGFQALLNNTTGFFNTAIGRFALGSSTGTGNTALGLSAGSSLTTGNNNIDINNTGAPGEFETIRIGASQTRTFIAGINGVPVTGTGVVVSLGGQLGVAPSSQRFKDELKPMDKASESILALKPVTFRYKQEIDPEGIPQFGLVAEDVEKVNPDLVVRDENGEIYTVRYDAVNAMLLNEFLKEHREVEHHKAIIADLRSAMAQQRKDFETTKTQQQNQLQALTASLKEQAAQIQKVSAQIEVATPSSRAVMNKP